MTATIADSAGARHAERIQLMVSHLLGCEPVSRFDDRAELGFGNSGRCHRIVGECRKSTIGSEQDSLPPEQVHGCAYSAAYFFNRLYRIQFLVYYAHGYAFVAGNSSQDFCFSCAPGA